MNTTKKTIITLSILLVCGNADAQLFQYRMPIRSAIDSVVSQRCEGMQCQAVGVSDVVTHINGVPVAIPDSEPMALRSREPVELTFDSMGDRMAFRMEFRNSATKARRDGKIHLWDMPIIALASRNDRVLDELQLAMASKAIEDGQFSSVGAIDWSKLLDALSKVDWQKLIETVLTMIKLFG